ncbi:sulfur carrier protein ThiS [Mycobacterium sp. CBMA271]|uniref:sulfur carrier protein ThiS n=1 Tax=unclassified Mycobacteroides TaxID=2618759 RepID=UPI0012DEC215|nr:MULTISPECIES: sulfur carrier protein ThiS [unclassified Mycobacteroides]MUM15381.1 thiamine biosynthesis protein ThiS [Mycobacteroides sp. CBMA 326]MUM21282.1 sulfur carrier protein ThiS [Mycobacteroides sp. CBMA 271]
MNVQVNGDAREVAEGASIWELLDQLGFPERGIAVAINHTVVPKSDWDTTVSDGATVEVVTAVQGG